MASQEHKGINKDEGKARLDLVPPSAIKSIARVLGKGLDKYPARNWELGMNWSKQIGSLERHLMAFLSGEDYDPESGCLHIEHILTRAAMINEFYRTYPQGDDRAHAYLNEPRIALDIDGVIANFLLAVTHKSQNSASPFPCHYDFPYSIYETWKNELSTDWAFWANIEPLITADQIPFIPVCYVTARPCPIEWTKEWLEANGFPCMPVISSYGVDKSPLLKEHNIDIFVDDCFDNFVECNKAGVCTFLFDQPYNRKHDVGYKRITSLKELIKKA